MKYYSISNHALTATFKEATIQGIAADKGLFFPETIPALERIAGNLQRLSDTEIALEIMKPFTGNDIEQHVLQAIVQKTLSFPLPVKKLDKHLFCLELFHGPTLAFKDIGARFLAECLGYFNKDEAREVTVLVATSGDTGGAVAHGFYKVPGVKVVILYPAGMVSALQEKQLVTPGENIRAIKVNADFDTCQALVKNAFTDKELQQQLRLTSANSINIARWLPQMFYYWLAFKQMLQHGGPTAFSVPSGNFGNVCAGIMARATGLPVGRFIAATNVNDTIPRYLSNGGYLPKPTVKTISNAMDISQPSNFSRIHEIARHRNKLVNELLSAHAYTDEATIAGVKELYSRFGYMADPHGAIAYLGAKQLLRNAPGVNAVFLETAHPVKFDNTLNGIYTIPVPEGVKEVLHKPLIAVSAINGSYSELKEALLA